MLRLIPCSFSVSNKEVKIIAIWGSIIARNEANLIIFSRVKKSVKDFALILLKISRKLFSSASNRKESRFSITAAILQRNANRKVVLLKVVRFSGFSA